MSNTPNNALPYVPENTIDPAAGLNMALVAVDALLQCAVLDELAAPPGAPAEGARYLIAAGATGAWAGLDAQLATWTNGAWAYAEPHIVLNLTTGRLLVRQGAAWAPALPGVDTGWTAGSGTPYKGAFDAGTATLPQVAARLLAVEQFLFAIRMLSA